MLKDMPKLGIGTFRLEGDQAYQSVLMALQEGYRHVDTAQIYGNESQVGHAVKDSGISREEIFLTTKIWLDNLSEEKFLPSLRESLQKLQVEVVDLLLIHWPSKDLPLKGYLQELKKVKDMGLAVKIGVSNFTIAQLQDSISILGEGEVFTNQIEVHPYFQNPKIVKFCQDNHILVSAYLPFAQGKLISDPVIGDIANKHHTTPANVLLAWLFMQGMTAFPSSTKRENLKSNLDSLNLILDAEDMKKIATLERNERMIAPDFSPAWD